MINVSPHRKHFLMIGAVAILLLASTVFAQISQSPETYSYIKSFVKNFGQNIGANSIASSEASDLKLTNYPVRLIQSTVLGAKSPGRARAVAGGSCDIKLVSNATSSGLNINYEFIVSNEGTQSCSTPSLTLHYTVGETVQSTSPSATSSNYYWRFAKLAPGQGTKVNIVTTYSGQNLNTEACATANNGSDYCIVNSIADSPTSPTTPDPVVSPVTDSTSTFTPKGEYGMWVWISPVQMTAAYRSQLLQTASNTKVNVLYVTIDDYLDIYNLAPSATKTSKLNSYNAALAQLISEAKAKNIAIDVEAGWRDWAQTDKRINAYNIVQYAANFNNSQPVNKIRKVQFDIEPYLLSTYESNKASVLTTYIEFVGELTKKANAVSMPLTMVIPHFYDSAQKWTPTINYNGKSTYTFNHLLSLLNTNPNSSIIVMSYRNFADGTDGTINISKQEVIDSTTQGGTTQIIVAQETGNVDPAYVTYFDTSKTYMFNQMTKVNNYFLNSSGYNGMALHYYEPFITLID